MSTTLIAVDVAKSVFEVAVSPPHPAASLSAAD
jgi:hypothetical protein